MSELWDIGILWTYRIALWRGLVVTVELSLLSYILGALLGLLLALLSMSRLRVLKLPAIFVIETARVLPVIVVVVWIYYALPILIGTKLEPFPAAVIAFTFAEAAILADVFRAGVQGLNRGQLEAGLAVGMNWAVVMRRIILPQAIMMMAPNLVNAYLGLLKWTSIASVIAVRGVVNRMLLGREEQQHSASDERQSVYYRALDDLDEGMVSLREIAATADGLARRRFNPIAHCDEWDFDVAPGQIARDFLSEVLRKLLIV